MAFTFIADGSGSSVNTNTALTVVMNTSGANVFFVATTSASSIADPVVSDTGGNNYSTPLIAITKNDVRHIFYVVSNPTTSSADQFQVSQTGCFPSIAVEAFSGWTAHDSSASNSGTGSTLGFTGVFPSETNCLIVTSLGFGVTGSPTIDDGFTTTAVGAFNPGNAYGTALAYKIQTAEVSETFTWTMSGSYNNAAICTVERDTPSGATGNPWYLYDQYRRQ